AGASSGYPGLWQINFALPLDVPQGCFVGVQVSAGGESGNSVTIPIAPPGQSSCSDPQLRQTSLAALDAGGAVKGGGFGVSRSTNTFYLAPAGGGTPTATTASQEAMGGGICRYTAAEYAALCGLPRVD